MAEQEQRKKKLGAAQRRDIILAAAVILTVIIIQWINRTDPILFQFGDNSMTITCPADTALSVELSYRNILSVTETDTLDPGTNLSGVSTDKCWFGVWQNSAYGQYTLCATPSVSRFIVLETAEGFVVCNYESDDSTQGLYKGLVELLEAKRQEG